LIELQRNMKKMVVIFWWLWIKLCTHLPQLWGQFCFAACWTNKFGNQSYDLVF